MRRGQVRRQRERAQRGFACRFDVLGVALLGELQEVGAPQVREARERTARPARRSSRAAESRFRAPAADSSAPAGRARADSPPAGRPPAPASTARGARRRCPAAKTSSSAAAATTTGASIQARETAAACAAADRRAVPAPMPIASDSAAIICPVLAKRFSGAALIAVSTTRASASGRSGRTSSSVRRVPDACAARSSCEIRALDRVLRRQQVEQHDADGVDVARDRRRLPEQQLRRHVGGRAARISSVPCSCVSPKSIRRIRPPSSRITLPALMSRWRNPAACTAPAARQTSMPTSAASRGPIAPWVARVPTASGPGRNRSRTRPALRGGPRRRSARRSGAARVRSLALREAARWLRRLD